MKKSKKILISTLCLCPMLLLTACVPPPNYLITASSSDSTWGRAEGAIAEEMPEGTEMLLTVAETSPTDHPFICWVKDYKTVATTESIFKLSYTEETAGHYTAVFEDEASKMLFATLSSIEFDGSGYTNIDYTLNYSSSASGSNNYSQLSSGTFDPNAVYNTDLTSVLYFGSLGSVTEYKFEINVAITDSVGAITNHTIRFAQKVDNSTFAGTSSCQISAQVGETETNIKLTFQKLTKDLYTIIEEE